MCRAGGRRSSALRLRGRSRCRAHLQRRDGSLRSAGRRSARRSARSSSELCRADVDLPGTLTREPSTIPVSYGGDAGRIWRLSRRLRGVPRTRWCGCTPRRAYRVYMLGFLPGFAYMGSVDRADRDAAARYAAPARARPGSVGIAGVADGHLSVRYAWRLADHRADLDEAVRFGARGAVSR